MLNKTLLCVLAAALGMSGTAISATVQTAAASSPNTNPDLTMTACHACPFSPRRQVATGMDQWYCLSRSGDLQAVRHRSGHGYHERCDLETEKRGVTERTGPEKGDAFWMTTTASKICPSSYPNVLVETDS